MENPKFEIIVGKDSQFYFRLIARNGETILNSEGYKSKVNCLNGITSVKNNVSKDYLFKRLKTYNGEHFFNLVAENGEVIGRSETYTTEQGCENGVQVVMDTAPYALVEDGGVVENKNRYYNFGVIGIFLVLLTILLVIIFGTISRNGNQQASAMNTNPTESNNQQNSIVSPTQAAVIPTSVKSKPVVTYPECASAPIGENVTCRISRAYCSYQPKTKGAPTFCNDAPYPSHHFILLRWGENWSHLNGKCLIVTGYNVLYKGIPEIIATSLSQVKTCD